MSSSTPLKVQGIRGDKLYQLRARAVLPILVRQARLGRTITYGELAVEAGIPTARLLNYPLGAIGKELDLLADRLGPIPRLQALVVNQATGLPGEGINEFFGNALQQANRAQRTFILRAALADVFAYQRWSEVLRQLDLAAVAADVVDAIEKARRLSCGSGEQEPHRRLKHAIAADPSLVSAQGRTEVEYRLPSGDSVDVLVWATDLTIAVEVKPENAPVADITRGLFQCVKYVAVLSAYLATTGRPANTIAVLALGGDMPFELRGLGKALGIPVFENLASALTDIAGRSIC